MKSAAKIRTICDEANLPTFGTREDALKDADYLHQRALASWYCKECKGFHVWSSAPTDTNGGYLAGSEKIPQRIQELIKKTSV